MRIAIAEDEAGQLRLQDSDAVLMFVTNMAQYAINGCAVGALVTFVLTPKVKQHVAEELKEKPVEVVVTKEKVDALFNPSGESNTAYWDNELLPSCCGGFLRTFDKTQQ